MKKLVLFEFHLLGDAVMSLPFLRAARERYEVYVCCSSAAAKIYELVLPPDRIFRMEFGSGQGAGGKQRAARRRVGQAIRSLGAEVGVTVWADIRVHLLMRSLGLRERIGFEMNERNYYAHHMGWRRRNLRIGRLIQGAAKLAGLRPLTRALERRDYRQHHMDDWNQLAESLGLTPDLSRPWLGPPGMEIVLPEKARPFFERNAGRKIWLLHPGEAGDRVHRSDMAIGMVLSAALGLGMLFLSLYAGFAGTAIAILFGDIFGVSRPQILEMVVLASLSLAALAFFSRKLLFASTQPRLAEARGLSLAALSIAFMIVVAVSVTLASQIVGILLVFTLVIAPAGIALRLCRSFWTGLATSVVLGVAGVWAGILLACVTNFPPTFWIASLFFLLYLATEACLRVRAGR